MMRRAIEICIACVLGIAVAWWAASRILNEAEQWAEDQEL